ncbi:hypothetical protein BDZ85DRAFT_264435 [Elsinoe ampelina]|uniref:Uncharacterized protein n=1 Tax=Elsinoe ampelina TaxID=302913 RepID=A0A6A6G8W9_9PEZI|nr:hypothetical protein BDZ85DRAFT_264435 [Elsinoe ampelina]
MKYQRPKVEDSASRQTSPVKPSMPTRRARSPSTPRSTRTQISPGWSMKAHCGSEDYEDWPTADLGYPIYSPISEGGSSRLTEPPKLHSGVSVSDIDFINALQPAIETAGPTRDDLDLMVTFGWMPRSKKTAIEYTRATKEKKAAEERHQELWRDHQNIHRELSASAAQVKKSRLDFANAQVGIIELARALRKTIPPSMTAAQASAKLRAMSRPTAPNGPKPPKDNEEDGGAVAPPQQDIKEETSAALPSPKAAPKPARSGEGAAARGGVQKRKSAKATPKKTARGVVKQTTPVRRSGRTKPTSK